MFLLYTTAGILTIIILIFAIPVGVELDYNSQTKYKSSTRIRWLFGLVNFKTSNANTTTRSKSTEIHSKSGKRKKTNVFKFSDTLLTLIKSRGFVKRVFKLVRDFLTVADIRHFRCYLGVGLDDPADTGQIYGMLSPISVFLHAYPQINFSFIPLFDRETFESKLNIELKIIPVKIIWVFLRFIFSRESLRAVFAVIKVSLK